MKFSFVLEGQAKPWQRTQLSRVTGKRYKPSATRKYQNHVKLTASVAMQRAGVARTWPRDATYMLRLQIFHKDKRVRDSDNVVKTIQDALKGLVWRDDHLVGLELPPPWVDRKRPRVEVEIEVIEHVREVTDAA